MQQRYRIGLIGIKFQMALQSVIIIGLGQIGVTYDLDLNRQEYCLTHARAFSEHPRFDLVAGVDIDDKRRTIFTKNYAVPAYEHIEEALRKENPTVAVICTPTEQHLKTIIKVLEQKGVRTILCEKPLAYDKDEATKMVNICNNQGVSLFVNYMRRSDNAVNKIKSEIEKGKILQPIKCIVWYSKGFYHNGSHFVDLMKYWLGPIESSKTINCTKMVSEDKDFDVDAEIKFKKGTAIFLSAWESAYSHYTVELVSVSGRLRYEQGGRDVTWQGIVKDTELANYNRLDKEIMKIQSDMKRYQYNVTNDLAGTLANDVEYRNKMCSGEEALKTLVEMNNIVRSY